MRNTTPYMAWRRTRSYCHYRDDDDDADELKHERQTQSNTADILATISGKNIFLILLR